MEESSKEIALNVHSNLNTNKHVIEHSITNEQEQVKETFLPAQPFSTFDDIFVIIGEFGRYQKLLYFMFSVTYIMTSMQLLGWVFIGAKASVRCLLPSEINQTKLPKYSDFPQNSTTSCSYVWNGKNVTFCDLGYVYDTSNIKYSAVMEWDLVCDNEGWQATVAAAPMLGYLPGGLIFGTMSDKFGRKPTFLICNMVLLITGMLGSIVPNYTEFLATRFLVGAAIAGVENTCFVMGMELVGPSKRTLAGILCWFFETSGLLLAVGLAYLFQDYDWRTLQVIYSCPGIIFFSYACLAPESIRWLASKGKYEQAELLLQKTANFNNVIISEDAISAAIKSSDDMENTAENDGTKTYTIFDLFRHRNLCAKTCVLQFTWIVCSALYYVLLLDQSELSEDHYLGFVATASVQIPGYIYVILTLDKPIFGRKRSICIFLMLSGICLIVHPFLMPRSIWKILLSVFGRFCANCSFTILHLFTAELFPTIVRSIGMGFSIVVSRIGTILAPYILLLGGEVSPVIFGLGVSLASILSLLLPETLGMPLPESISDGEKMKIVTPRNCLFGTKKNTNYNPEEEA